MDSHIPGGGEELPGGGEACPAECAWAQQQWGAAGAWALVLVSAGTLSTRRDRGLSVPAGTQRAGCWARLHEPALLPWADTGVLGGRRVMPPATFPPGRVAQLRAVSVGGQWRGPGGGGGATLGRQSGSLHQGADVGSGLCFRRCDLDGLPPDREHHRLGRAGERQDHQALEE